MRIKRSLDSTEEKIFWNEAWLTAFVGFFVVVFQLKTAFWCQAKISFLVLKTTMGLKILPSKGRRIQKELWGFMEDRKRMSGQNRFLLCVGFFVTVSTDQLTQTAGLAATLSGLSYKIGPCGEDQLTCRVIKSILTQSRSLISWSTADKQMIHFY